MDDKRAVASMLTDAEAVIYNIGILREFPDRRITFRKLHYEHAKRAMDATVAAGVGRFLLMSANGVRHDGTAYQRYKFEAERYLASTGLQWTVFRPSVIFGEPRGHSEFATQLLQDIILPPLPAPLFYSGFLPHNAGQFQLSPVHVEDVARAFVASLDQPATYGQVLELGGPRALSWRAIIQAIAAAVGRKKTMVAAPAVGVSAVASLLDRFDSFPITRDQLKMLMEGNTCGPDALLSLGITPKTFSVDNLRYLKPAIRESA
jgi:NADH dehydrogenase